MPPNPNGFTKAAVSAFRTHLEVPMILRKGVVLGAFDGVTLVRAAGVVPSARCQPVL